MHFETLHVHKLLVSKRYLLCAKCLIGICNCKFLFSPLADQVTEIKYIAFFKQERIHCCMQGRWTHQDVRN